MSVGALSYPAVKTLSYGAVAAGIWQNIGEGGLSDGRLEFGCDIVFWLDTTKGEFRRGRRIAPTR